MSFNNLFHSISSLPHYLEMSATGLDMSDQAIRFIKFSKNKKGMIVNFFGEEKLPQGIIVSGEIIKKDDLINILSSLRKKYQLKFVKVSLPEEKSYFFKTEIPKVEDGEIRQSIEFRLEENIPLKADEAFFQYDVINREHKSNNHLDVSVSAVPRVVAENYAEVLEKSGLFPTAFEVESRAVTRSVVRNTDNLSVMVVNIRDSATIVTMIKNGAVRFTSAFVMGGNSITKALEKIFSISFKEAEKMKEEKMFTESKESVAMFFSVIGVISEFKDEISKFYSYWLAKNDSGGESGGKISKIILCGKDSAIIGLKDYISQSLKTRVEIGNVWDNVFSIEQTLPEINFLKSLDFAVAIGLALPKGNG